MKEFSTRLTETKHHHHHHHQSYSHKALTKPKTRNVIALTQPFIKTWRRPRGFTANHVTKTVGMQYVQIKEIQHKNVNVKISRDNHQHHHHRYHFRPGEHRATTATSHDSLLMFWLCTTKQSTPFSSSNMDRLQ